MIPISSQNKMELLSGKSNLLPLINNPNTNPIPNTTKAKYLSKAKM